jgi:hypothetical protein
MITQELVQKLSRKKQNDVKSSSSILYHTDGNNHRLLQKEKDRVAVSENVSYARKMKRANRGGTKL